MNGRNGAAGLGRARPVTAARQQPLVVVRAADRTAHGDYVLNHPSLDNIARGTHLGVYDAHTQRLVDVVIIGRTLDGRSTAAPIDSAPAPSPVRARDWAAIVFAFAVTLGAAVTVWAIAVELAKRWP